MQAGNQVRSPPALSTCSRSLQRFPGSSESRQQVMLSILFLSVGVSPGFLFVCFWRIPDKTQIWWNQKLTTPLNAAISILKIQTGSDLNCLAVTIQDFFSCWANFSYRAFISLGVNPVQCSISNNKGPTDPGLSKVLRFIECFHSIHNLCWNFIYAVTQSRL